MGRDGGGRGAIGPFALRAGRRDDLWQLTPLYLRKSAAEEQRDRL